MSYMANKIFRREINGKLEKILGKPEIGKEEIERFAQQVEACWSTLKTQASGTARDAFVAESLKKDSSTPNELKLEINKLRV